MTESFLNDRVTLHPGNCLDVLATLEENSIDSVVTDPPYGLEFMGKEWDKFKTYSGGNPNLKPQGKSIKSVGDGYGYRQKNPRCRRCGKLKRGNGCCKCPEPQWDTRQAESANQFQFFCEDWAREVFRVLKPGGHLVSFGGTRTYHRMACGVEDAGFEVRECLMWIFGSGFPKSHDVSKGIDRARKDNEDWQRVGVWLKAHRVRAGHETRRSLAPNLPGYKNLESAAADLSNWENGLSFPTLETWALLKQLLSLPDEMDAEVWRLNGRKGTPGEAWFEREKLGEISQGRLAVAPGQDNDRSAITLDLTAPATDAAKQWDGWGTALKPAYEPIILARKPLSESTVAANVLRWGTGALNIDGCRVATASNDDIFAKNPHTHGGFGHAGAQIYGAGKGSDYKPQEGRWPANVLHDGSDEVVRGFPHSDQANGRPNNAGKIYGEERSVYGEYNGAPHNPGYLDSGSAARFFYSAKADQDDRLGSKHPTVKPVDLIEYLEVLVTPPGGTILDPFAGTGTAGEAAFRRGFKAILIEREEEYCNDIRRRMALCMSGPNERSRESIKAKMKDKPQDNGPLFAAAAE